MKSKHQVWLAGTLALALVLVSVWTVVQWHRRSGLLARLAELAVSEKREPMMPTVKLSSVLEKREDTSELQAQYDGVLAEVERLREQKRCRDKQEEAFVPKLSLEEYRETQPEAYEELKRKIAATKRYARLRIQLRQEYLDRLDLNVLTAEELQRFREGLAMIQQRDEAFLYGCSEAELVHFIDAAGVNTSERWLMESTEICELAQMASGAFLGRDDRYVEIMRAQKLFFGNLVKYVPSPQKLRGTFWVNIIDPEASNGIRTVYVKVEPGWQP